MKSKESETHQDYLSLLEQIPHTILYQFFQNELNKTLDCIQEGVFITDGDSNILYLNQASVNLSQYTAEELIGKNVKVLLKEGYFTEDEVTTLSAIEEGRPISRVQKSLRGEYDIISTSIPYLKNGKIERVITTERDVTQLLRLEENIRKTKQLMEEYKHELDYYRNIDQKLLENVICHSDSIKKTVEMAFKIAKQDVTVLIQGESGVGKEVIAKLIAKSSDRKDKPFIKINCGALPESLIESELYGYEKGAFTGASEKGKLGLFELANGGTLFLDEIGTLSMQMQVKLLRAIQEKEIFRIGGSQSIPVNVRILAATNIDLKDAVKNNQFRNDLYYRLNVFPITIAPLRSRKEDIPYLSETFLKKFNQKYNCVRRLDEKALSVFMKYHWPGNVRELENILERLVLTSDDVIISAPLVLSYLGEVATEGTLIHTKDSEGLKKALEDYEKKIIMANLPYYKTLQELAQVFKINKSTLSRKMKAYRIPINHQIND